MNLAVILFIVGLGHSFKIPPKKKELPTAFSNLVLKALGTKEGFQFMQSLLALVERREGGDIHNVPQTKEDVEPDSYVPESPEEESIIEDTKNKPRIHKEISVKEIAKTVDNFAGMTTPYENFFGIKKSVLIPFQYSFLLHNAPNLNEPDKNRTLNTDLRDSIILLKIVVNCFNDAMSEGLKTRTETCECSGKHMTAELSLKDDVTTKEPLHKKENDTYREFQADAKIIKPVDADLSLKDDVTTKELFHIQEVKNYHKFQADGKINKPIDADLSLKDDATTEKKPHIKEDENYHKFQANGNIIKPVDADLSLKDDGTTEEPPHIKDENYHKFQADGNIIKPVDADLSLKDESLDEISFD